MTTERLVKSESHDVTFIRKYIILYAMGGMEKPLGIDDFQRFLWYNYKRIFL